MVIMYGGSIKSWKDDHKIKVGLPSFCNELQRELGEIKHQFTEDESMAKYHNAEHFRRSKAGKQWENGALAYWLQDLEAQCMISCINF
jgi:hypothetical protein